MTTDSAKKACIFCDGELKNSARIKRVAGNCDLLIAADGVSTLVAVDKSEKCMLHGQVGMPVSRIPTAPALLP